MTCAAFDGRTIIPTLFVLPLAFLGGIAFAALWLRWLNLWIASAAHVMLNAAFTLFCFGGFDGSCRR